MINVIKITIACNTASTEIEGIATYDHNLKWVDSTKLKSLLAQVTSPIWFLEGSLRSIQDNIVGTFQLQLAPNENALRHKVNK